MRGVSEIGEFMRWYFAAFAAVAVVVLVVLENPLIAFATVGGLLALWLYSAKPKIGAAVSVIGILFGSGFATSTGVGALGYLDEALVILPAVVFPGLRLLRQLPPRWLPGLGWIAVYVMLGSVSSIVNDVPTLLAAQSTFLVLKGFLFAFAVAQLDWTPDDVKKAARCGAIVLAIVLAVSVVNFLIPEVWTSIFSRRSKGIDYRLGMPSLIGPFDHEFAYGQFMALSAVAVLAYRSNVQKGLASAVLLAGSFLGLVLSFRRKAIAAALTALLSVRILTPGKRTSAFVAAVLALPIVAIVSWDAVSSVVDATYTEYFTDPTKTARTRFYADGAALAMQSFPFGVGFARFGSYMAGEEYSPEYVKLGYNLVYGLAPGDRGPYLSDTFWPAIAGESGWFGLMAFALALVAMARVGLKLIKASEDKYVRWAGVVLAAWVVEFTVESIAAPVFNTPPIFALLFGAAGLAASLLAQQPARLDPAPLTKGRALALR